MHVTVHEIRTQYEFRLPNGHVLFRVEEASLAHEQFSGAMSSDIVRVNFERGDGVGVLLYDETEDAVVLVEQFRFPVHQREKSNPDLENGWLMEIVAGIKDDNGPAVARREVLEETGYVLSAAPEHLSTCYLSPGGTSERLEIYLAPVQKSEVSPRHGGLESESEDIRIHALGLREALDRVADGRIRDAKTIIGLLMLERRLR